MLTIRKKMRVAPVQLILWMLVILAVSGCDVLGQQKPEGLRASGLVEATEVAVSSELGGRIVEVFVGEGESVQAGDPLFRLDGELLEAQRRRAIAALEAAEANVQTARAALAVATAARTSVQAGIEAAHIQRELALSAARLADQPARASAWGVESPEAFSLPGWYFDKAEQIAAAEAAFEAARQALETEGDNFAAVIQSAGDADLRAAEARLAAARTNFLIAAELLNRQIAAAGKDVIDQSIRDLYDNASSKLESAQEAFDALLSDQAYEDVLEARARLVVAQERCQTALDHLNQLLTGEASLPVRAAEAAVRQAEAGMAQVEAGIAQAEAVVAQAEKAVAQARVEIEAIEVQLAHLVVHAPVSGVIVTRSVQPGEVIQPGMAAVVIAQLDKLTVTVYLPEDRYGQVSLGDHARLTADSFPDEVFAAVVTRIADHAEYTPRNVQTQEDRQTTVYAVELSVDDPNGKLKPGMPCDVDFGVFRAYESNVENP